VTGLQYSGGTLTVQNGTVTVATLMVGAGYQQGDFSFGGDGGTGFDLTTTSFACFATGARILTARGEVAVEALRVGDRVVALQGGRLARVRWIGHARAWAGAGSASGERDEHHARPGRCDHLLACRARPARGADGLAAESYLDTGNRSAFDRQADTSGVCWSVG
jgi:hypothetical protein